MMIKVHSKECLCKVLLCSIKIGFPYYSQNITKRLIKMKLIVPTLLIQNHPIIQSSYLKLNPPNFSPQMEVKMNPKMKNRELI